MKSTANSSTQKKQIYFARTYRHLHMNPKTCILFMLGFLLPSMILLLIFYDELTYIVCNVAARVIHEASGEVASISSDVFLPGLGPVYFLTLPTTALPSYEMILCNLGVSLMVLWFLSSGPRKGRPVVIYLSITLMIHIISCVFFLLGRNLFPYTLTDYSELYIKQQVGIWVTFLLLIGLLMGILSHGTIVHRVVTVVGVMIYSLVFALVRYVLFLYVLTEFSVLYMPLMFFALGPFFDFSYFVAIYAISTNGMIRLYNSKRKGDWMWA